MSVATGESIETIESRYDGEGYGTFKADVAEAVIDLLSPFQERFHELRGDTAELQSDPRPRRGKGARGIGSDALE